MRLLSLGSTEGRTSAGAVFVVLDFIILLLSALVTGSILTPALGVGGYVWQSMLQIVTPP